MMDVDSAEIQAQRTYPSPKLHEERRRRGQCMQCGQTGHIMKNCPRGYLSKWNTYPTNARQSSGQSSSNQRTWTPQPNHMPPQPSRPLQYTPARPRDQTTRTRGYNEHIVDDRSPMQTPIQVHPTTNPGEAEQVLDGMVESQPARWRDLNQQDFS